MVKKIFNEEKQEYLNNSVNNHTLLFFIPPILNEDFQDKLINIMCKKVENE
jgi:hypothetical protein